MTEPTADASSVASQVETIRRALDARAAGLWRVEGTRLVQVAFVPAPDLATEVARAFANATRAVPLDQLDLGIVGAAARREPAVSLAADLPAAAGSGYWLRAFGARRSVAVPLLSEHGPTLAVVSVALAQDEPPADVIAESLRDHARHALASLLACQPVTPSP